MQVSPYLYFTGQCEEAFNFYAKCLDAKIEAMMTHEGSPAEAQTPPEWKKKILHARMNVEGVLIMGSDAPPGRGQKAQGFSVSLSFKNPADAERVYNALSENATSIFMPLQETFWALKFAMFNDKFGTPWMVNCEKVM